MSFLLTGIAGLWVSLELNYQSAALFPPPLLSPAATAHPIIMFTLSPAVEPCRARLGTQSQYLNIPFLSLLSQWGADSVCRNFSPFYTGKNLMI